MRISFLNSSGTTGFVKVCSISVYLRLNANFRLDELQQQGNISFVSYARERSLRRVFLGLAND